MDPRKNTMKKRIILGIGLDIIERPRQLQPATGEGEHGLVHVLYTLQKQGLVTYKMKRNMHSPGMNLTKIRLTPEGQKLWRQIK